MKKQTITQARKVLRSGKLGALTLKMKTANLTGSKPTTVRLATKSSAEQRKKSAANSSFVVKSYQRDISEVKGAISSLAGRSLEEIVQKYRR